MVLLTTGVELLQERGLLGGAAHITLNEVFTAVAERRGERITPASVYQRIWPTQADFQADLLIAAAAFYPDGEEQPTLDAAREVVRGADLSTLEGRFAALHEVCRVAGDVHVRVLEASRAWQIWVGFHYLNCSELVLQCSLTCSSQGSYQYQLPSTFVPRPFAGFFASFSRQRSVWWCMLNLETPLSSSCPQLPLRHSNDWLQIQ